MGLLSRKKRSAAEDVALPLPELDADSAPAPATEATSSDEDITDAVDLSVVDPGAGAQPTGADASPAAPAEAQAGGVDDLDLFRGLSYVSPETELLLSRVKDVSAAQLLADLRQVRALLMHPPGGTNPGVPF
jgi:hypothetical protein